ncbi:hypothetical protein BREU_2006 [Bifidobacterium reuteri DSM 23975]|uniref:Uncharacterized protein n=2 Tax=Bifidobacterium reuteri TaxID=983706 RepID=A0A087CPT1_9BIFI|nr:hypothetical protein BREU_2006 [Bifidobacterium reuteri DSM 23975]
MLEQMRADAEADMQTVILLERAFTSFAHRVNAEIKDVPAPSFVSALSALSNTADDLHMLAVNLRDGAQKAKEYSRRLGM